MEHGKHYHHEQYTGGSHQHGHQTSHVGSHQHGHQTSYVGSHQHGHHTPHIDVTTSSPHIQVATTPSYIGRSNYSHNHYHSYSSQGSRTGARVLILGAFIILPIVIIAAILSSTLGMMGMTTASLTTAGVAGAGAASAIGFSAATFGIGALVLYGVAGLAYLYSSAKECYSSDKNVLNMIKSRVVNEDGTSFKGIMKSIGSVLWSPFLLIGGLAGMGIKAAVNACVSKPATSTKDVDTKVPGSYSGMGSDFLPSNSQKQGNDKVPFHPSTQLFADVPETEVDSHLLKSQTSLYPSLSPMNTSIQ